MADLEHTGQRAEPDEGRTKVRGQDEGRMKVRGQATAASELAKAGRRSKDEERGSRKRSEA